MIILSTLKVISSISVFLLLILTLITVILFVKTKLSPSGKIKIMINGEKEIEVDGGSTLLTTLSNEGIFLPSACGGGGTCVQCTCQVNSGGGGILPTEEPHFSRKKIAPKFYELSFDGYPFKFFKFYKILNHFQIYNSTEVQQVN